MTFSVNAHTNTNTNKNTNTNEGQLSHPKEIHLSMTPRHTPDQTVAKHHFSSDAPPFVSRYQLYKKGHEVQASKSSVKVQWSFV